MFQCHFHRFHFWNLISISRDCFMSHSVNIMSASSLMPKVFCLNNLACYWKKVWYLWGWKSWTKKKWFDFSRQTSMHNAYCGPFNITQNCPPFFCWVCKILSFSHYIYQNSKKCLERNFTIVWFPSFGVWSNITYGRFSSQKWLHLYVILYQ